jgi:hypothetical protein
MTAGVFLWDGQDTPGDLFVAQEQEKLLNSAFSSSLSFEYAGMGGQWFFSPNDLAVTSRRSHASGTVCGC